MATVNENTPLFADTRGSRRPKVYNNQELMRNDDQYNDILYSMEQAFQESLYPIADEHSKGVYSVHNLTNQIVGVFRPKDEEYVPLESTALYKISNWLLLGCVRTMETNSSLVPRQRYLSEIGASIIDRILGLNIVPKTRILRLSSPTFDYSVVNRIIASTKRSFNRYLPIIGKFIKRIDLPAKIGSLKCYREDINDIRSFEEANKYLEKYKSNNLTELFSNQLQFEFEKLVVLTYIIRNTDSRENKWLIKFDESYAKEMIELRQTGCLELSGTHSTKPSDELIVSTDANVSDTITQPSTSSVNRCENDKAFRIVALNVSEGFPFKNKRGWIAGTYSWTRFDLAEQPFSTEIKHLVLTKLTDFIILKQLFDEIKNEFQSDADFKPIIFEKQMAIIRGQICNLIDACLENTTPLELSKKLFRTFDLNTFNRYIEWVRKRKEVVVKK